MMDIRATMTGPNLADNDRTSSKPVNIYDDNAKEYSSSTTEEEEEDSSYKPKKEEDRQVEKTSAKRSLEEDYYFKKRRKQLKPNRITSFEDERNTFLFDMVKVPKNTIKQMSNSVPPKNLEKCPVSRNRSPLKDVYIHNEEYLNEELEDGREKLNMTEALESVTSHINVPRVSMGPIATNPSFMFPFSFSTPDIMANPNYWQEKIRQGESFRIFNQEAYCELCKKEFCNKYFLKTHKANKHGIYVDISTVGNVRSKEQEEVSASSLAGRSTSENSEGLEADDKIKAYCDVCNKKFCNKYFVRRHKSKSHGFVAALEDCSMEATSDHSQGKCTNDEKRIERSESVSISETNGTSDNQYSSKSYVDVGNIEEQKSPLNLMVNVGNETDGDESNDSKERTEKKFVENDEKSEENDDCSSENLEKLQTMLLRLNPSDLENKSNEIDFFEKRSDDESLEEIKEMRNESSQNSEYFLLNKSIMEEQLKQMKSQPTSSYCEICNKELCNKYFMRTHMQRMHGIEIEHGAQIGGVVCNICNKELCSKYFLRVHKQNTHGVASPGMSTAPSTSSVAQTSPKEPTNEARFYSNFTQVCFICSRRFRSPKWLQAHLLSDHREELLNKGTEEVVEETEATLKIPRQSPEKSEPSNVISKLFWENSSCANTYNCSQCSFSTPVLAFLFVHERSHFVFPVQNQDQSESVKPSVSLQNLIQNKTFWQHKITQAADCLDLSTKNVAVERNGS